MSDLLSSTSTTLQLEFAKSLVDTLPQGLNGLFNPWKDSCPDDSPWNTPVAKLIRLAEHLSAPPRFILCGEAPGYQGCVRSGIAFTSERLILEGAIPRITPPPGRLTARPLPFSEPSATIVWKALYRLGIAECTVLWNAVQLHPHHVGRPLTNRTPTDNEIGLGAPALRLLTSTHPTAKLVAIGKKAEGLLKSMGLDVFGAVRHPANGGATEFAAGLYELVNQSRKESL